VIDAVLQDRAALARSQAFAVYNTDAQEPLSRAILDEIGESGFGLADRHAMQINFGLNTEAPARQLAHCPAANRLATKAHAFCIAAFHRVDVRLHALTQGIFLIRPREPRFGFWLFRGSFDALAGTQWLCSGYRTVEEVYVVITQGGVLRLKHSKRIPQRLLCGHGYFWIRFEYSEHVAHGQTFEHLPH